jgi:hypothetical protein
MSDRNIPSKDETPIPLTAEYDAAVAAWKDAHGHQFKPCTDADHAWVAGYARSFVDRRLAVETTDCTEATANTPPGARREKAPDLRTPRFCTYCGYPFYACACEDRKRHAVNGTRESHYCIDCNEAHDPLKCGAVTRRADARTRIAENLGPEAAAGVGVIDLPGSSFAHRDDETAIADDDGDEL